MASGASNFSQVGKDEGNSQRLRLEESLLTVFGILQKASFSVVQCKYARTNHCYETEVTLFLEFRFQSR